MVPPGASWLTSVLEIKARGQTARLDGSRREAPTAAPAAPSPAAGAFGEQISPVNTGSLGRGRWQPLEPPRPTLFSFCDEDHDGVCVAMFNSCYPHRHEGTSGECYRQTELRAHPEPSRLYAPGSRLAARTEGQGEPSSALALDTSRPRLGQRCWGEPRGQMPLLWAPPLLRAPCPWAPGPRFQGLVGGAPHMGPTGAARILRGPCLLPHSSTSWDLSACFL